MLPPRAVPPYSIRLPFKLTDIDGLHQAQLLIPITIGDPDFSINPGGIKLQDCQSLSGQNIRTGFVTTQLMANPLTEVTLQVMDTKGNFTKQTFPIDVTDLLPRPEVVSIPDPNLLAAIREALALAPTENITQLDMLGLVRLEANDRQITRLTGLEHATNLRSLNLRGNQISDISSLTKLIYLTTLSLDDNQIIELRPLAKLTRLAFLTLSNNQITDITALTGLTNLSVLEIDRNQIGNITGIEHATNLTWLNLSQNPIVDITPLASLINLTGLWMYGNQAVHNIAPLSRLTNLTRLGLSGNQIVDITPLSGLTNLTSLNLAWNHIRDISPLADLVNLEELSFDGNHIRDMEPLHALLKQKPDIALDIDISQFPEEISKVVVSIPDANLAAVVRETLNLTSKDRLTHLDMLWLTGLNASGREIANLTGIEYAKNLKWLWLSNNHITDILPLATLVNLDRLSLWRNQISDITPLANLTNLSNLEIGRNQISDVTPLTQLVNLKKLQLAENPIEDISSLYALLEKISSINLDIAHILYPLDKITGPWLWMIVPTEIDKGGAASIDLDSLNIASSDAVTEIDIAVNGAKEGDTIGDYAWMLGEIPEHGNNNVNDLVNKIGFVDGGNPETTADDIDINDHSSYALITLESITVQSNVTMLAGSDDAIKIWLNGEVAHKNQVNRDANDFQDIFKIDLKAGDNLLMVKVSELTGRWSLFIGIDADVKVKQQFTNTAEKIAAAPRGYEVINPAETSLLPNYPNPFNPETWIPYQLAVPSDVSISIYAADGQLVRTLSLGHQPMGVYESRIRAAYWDSRNRVGESVASGVYFYTLTAGDFTATRKMLILK